jgi:hypothetical protein
VNSDQSLNATTKAPRAPGKNKRSPSGFLGVLLMRSTLCLHNQEMDLDK